MALDGIIPVNDVNRAILIVELVERLGPCVIEVEKILAVLAHIPGAAALRDVDIQALAVNVSNDQLATVFRRPAFAAIAHHTRMGMTAPDGIPARGCGMRPAVTRPMNMVRVLLNVVIDVRVNRFAVQVAAVAAEFADGDWKMFAALALQTG